MSNAGNDRKRLAQKLVSRHRWRRAAIVVALAATVGVLLRATVGFNPVDWLINRAQTVWLLFFDEAGFDAAFKSWTAANPAANRVIGWLSGAIAAGLIATIGLQSSRVRAALERRFPPPPSFVFCDLELERMNTMSRLERRPPTFIGRETELAELQRLFEHGPNTPYTVFHSLVAASGTGKTRLAIEWLAEAQLRGWDVGIIDRRDLAALEHWCPRRPTALVIDEARTMWAGVLEEALQSIATAGKPKCPIRVLLLAQHPPLSELVALDGRSPQRFGKVQTLSPMHDSAMTVLVDELCPGEAVTERIVTNAAGRPRAAIILANATEVETLSEAMMLWAGRVLPELRSADAEVSPNLAVGLLASALAGPLLTSALTAEFPELTLAPLQRFFPGAKLSGLEREIPALEPQDLARELVFQLLPRLGPEQRRRLMETLAKAKPEAVHNNLGAIWRDRPHLFWEDGGSSEQAQLLNTVERQVETLLEKPSFAMQQRVIDLSECLQPQGSEIDLAAANSIMAEVRELAERDPFHVWLRNNQARAAYGLAVTAQQAGDTETALAAVDEIRRISRHPALAHIVEAARQLLFNAIVQSRVIQSPSLPAVEVCELLREMAELIETVSGEERPAYALAALFSLHFLVGNAEVSNLERLGGSVAELERQVDTLWSLSLTESTAELDDCRTMLSCYFMNFLLGLKSSELPETLYERWYARTVASLEAYQQHPEATFERTFYFRTYIMVCELAALCDLTSSIPIEHQEIIDQYLKNASERPYAECDYFQVARWLSLASASYAKAGNWTAAFRCLTGLLNLFEGRAGSVSGHFQEIVVVMLRNLVHQVGESGNLEQMDAIAGTALRLKSRLSAADPVSIRHEYAQMAICAYSHYCVNKRHQSPEGQAWRIRTAKELLANPDAPGMISRCSAQGLPFNEAYLHQIIATGIQAEGN